MRRIGIEERRARLGVRHHLATEAKAASAVDAASGVVALHASDPASVFLSVHARTDAVPLKAIEQAQPVCVLPRFRTPLERELDAL